MWRKSEWRYPLKTMNKIGGAMTGTQLIAIGLVLGGGLIWWLRPGSKQGIATSI